MKERNPDNLHDLAICEGDFQKETVSSVDTKEPDFREIILQADETRLR